MATSNPPPKYSRDSSHCKTIEYEYHSACDKVKTLYYSIHQDPLKTTLGAYIRDLDQYVKRSFEHIHMVDIQNLHEMIESMEPCTTYRLKYRQDCIEDEPSGEDDIKQLNSHEHARKEYLRVLNDFKKLRMVIEQKAIHESTATSTQESKILTEIEKEVDDDKEKEKQLQIEQKLAEEKLSQFISSIEEKSREREERKRLISLKRQAAEQKYLSAFVDVDTKKKSILSDVKSIDSDLVNLISIPQDIVIIENLRALSFTIQEFERIIIHCGMSSEILLHFLLVCNFVNINSHMGVTSDDCLKTLESLSTRKILFGVLQLPGMSQFLDVLLVSNPTDTQLNNLDFLASMDVFTFFIMARDTEEIQLPDGIKYTSYKILTNSNLEMAKFRFFMSEVVFALRKLVIHKSESNQVISDDDLNRTIHIANNMAIRKLPKLAGTQYTFATKLSDRVAQIQVEDKQFAIPINVISGVSGSVNINVPDVFKVLWSLSSHIYIPGISSSILKFDDRGRYTFSNYKRNGRSEFIHVKFTIKNVWKPSSVFRN